MPNSPSCVPLKTRCAARWSPSVSTCWTAIWRSGRRRRVRSVQIGEGAPPDEVPVRIPAHEVLGNVPVDGGGVLLIQQFVNRFTERRCVGFRRAFQCLRATDLTNPPVEAVAERRRGFTPPHAPTSQLPTRPSPHHPTPPVERPTPPAPARSAPGPPRPRRFASPFRD